MIKAFAILTVGLMLAGSVVTAPPAEARSCNSQWQSKRQHRLNKMAKKQFKRQMALQRAYANQSYANQVPLGWGAPNYLQGAPYYGTAANSYAPIDPYYAPLNPYDGDADYYAPSTNYFPPTATNGLLQGLLNMF